MLPGNWVVCPAIAGASLIIGQSLSTRLRLATSALFGAGTTTHLPSSSAARPRSPTRRVGPHAPPSPSFLLIRWVSARSVTGTCFVFT